MRWMKVIITVGRPISENDPHSTDAFISSLLLLVVIVGTGVAMSLANSGTRTDVHWSNITMYGERRGNPIDNECTVHILLIVYTLVAMVTMTWMWLSSDIGAMFAKPHRSLMMSFKVYLKYVIVNSPSIVGMWVFFTLVVILHVLVFAAYMPCWIIPRDWTVSCVVVTFYDVVHFIFMVYLFAFCCKFHNCTVQRDPLISYGLVIVTAATMTVWFDGAFSTYFYNDPDRNNCFKHCLGRGTHRYNMLKTVGLFMYPLNIQFLIMSINILCQLFMNAVTSESFQRATATELPNSNEDPPNDSPGEIVPANETQNDASQRNNDISDSRGRALISSMSLTCCCFNSPKVHVPLILLFHALMVVFTVPNFFFEQNLIVFYATTSTADLVLICVVSLFGFHSVSQLKTELRPYKGLEMYLLVTSVGFVITVIFDLACGCEAHKTILSKPPLSIISVFIFLLRLLLQTLFMFRATRTIMPLSATSQSHEADDANLRKNASVFFNVVFFLMTTNAINWIFQSILRVPLFGELAIKPHNDMQNFVAKIMRPLYLFYSFNVSLVFLGVYLKRCIQF